VTAAVLPSLAPSDERARVDLVLQGSRIGPLLAERLGLAPSVSHVLDAKYEPGAYCTALHQLGHELVTVRVSLDEAEADPGGVVVAPGTRAFRFPDDPALRGLADALHPAWLEPRLAEALAADLRISRIGVVRYRPAKRATLRVEVWVRATGGHRERRVLFAKIYHRATKAAAVYDEARRLVPWAAGREGLGLAPTVGFLADVPMVVQEGVVGTPLDELLHRGRAPALTAAAEALAVLHEAPLVSARARPIDAELVRFGRRAAAIAQVAPAVGDALGALAEALVEARPVTTTDRTALVHGDCKPSQFLVGPAGATLLDLDHCGLADPASDVGTFLATVRQRALRASGAGQPVGAVTSERRFLDAYATAAGADGDFLASARWYQAVALCRKALRAFARSPRSPLALGLGGEAHRLVNEAASQEQ
jgi:hypothetical protein